MYNNCKKRGDFAYGSLFIGDPQKCKSLVTTKSPGSVTLKASDIYEDEQQQIGIDDIKLFLGHTQAPTSSVREFSVYTSHPFTCGEWVVAHNGVLTNYDQVKRLIKDEATYNAVDTSLIPAFLNQTTLDGSSEIQAMSHVLSKLKGTFGLWLFNKQTGNTYLARAGSTLHSNFLTNDFSSLPEKNYQPLDEGVIYLMTQEGLTSVDSFIVNSPFFII